MRNTNNRNEIRLSNCRWMLFTQDNRLITENHNQGITWKSVYKQEYGNMKALCFQLLPQGGKVFAKESPFNEYWTYEEFELLAGQSVPTHVSRNICSLQSFKDIGGIKVGMWHVTEINVAYGRRTFMADDQDIGYEIRNYINKKEEQTILRGI